MRVARCGEHQADCREIVAGDVAGEVFAVAIPAAVGLGLWFEPGAFAEIGEHTVRLELEEIVGIEVLGVLKRAASQADGGEGKWSGDVRDDGLDGSGEAGESQD